jgi:hypothetical protein
MYAVRRQSRYHGIKKQGPVAVEEMNEEQRDQAEQHERGTSELHHATAQALGFLKTVEYQGILFNISRRFVIADLSPLAFFHLIEPIDEHASNGITAAIATLYHRLLPLLSCRHDWTHLKRGDDDRFLTIMVGDRLRTGAHPNICRSCTAYALEQSLPVVGRGSIVGPVAGPGSVAG